MTIQAIVASVLLLASAGSPTAKLPPLQCRDAAGHVVADAASPRRVGGAITRPKMIKSVNPDYGELRKKYRVGGAIIIESVIDRRGRICAARLMRGQGDPVAEAALQAFRQWEFKPATLDGKPVAVYYFITMTIDVQ